MAYLRGRTASTDIFTDTLYYPFLMYYQERVGFLRMSFYLFRFWPEKQQTTSINVLLMFRLRDSTNLYNEDTLSR